MKSHRRRGPIGALILALVACTALAAPAAAEPGADYPQPSTAKIGDTPADFARPVAQSADSKAKAGDTPVDDPGASRAPRYAATTTIQVVRPERTIVRNVDQLLPVVLSGVALALALGGSAFLLLTSIRRRRLGSTH